MAHIEVKKLPAAIQAELKALKYGIKDIEVIKASQFTMPGNASSNRRGVVSAVDLRTGRAERLVGNYGGQNPFTGYNPVDYDTKPESIRSGEAVIIGSCGYPATWLKIYTESEAILGLLPAEGPELPESHMTVLIMYVSLTPAGRKDAIRRYRITNADQIIDDLVADGYLKRNRAGATQITTAGKSAVGNRR